MINSILIVTFSVVLSIAVLLAAYLAICALAQRAYLMGRNDALQTRPAEILKAKTEGMRAERELWVRSGQVDLKPQRDFAFGPGEIDIHDLANAVIEAQAQNKFQS